MLALREFELSASYADKMIDGYYALFRRLKMATATSLKIASE